MTLTLSPALRRRLRRWEAITGLTLSQMAPRAIDAHAGYTTPQWVHRCPSERYSSGYEAGGFHADALPDGYSSSDRRIRAWGDFLIDLGAFAEVVGFSDDAPQQQTCTACGGSGVGFSPAHEPSSRHTCGCCAGSGSI